MATLIEEDELLHLEDYEDLSLDADDFQCLEKHDGFFSNSKRHYIHIIYINYNNK